MICVASSKHKIHALGADVEQQIARRGDRVARSGANLPERMQFAGRGGPKSRSHASDPNPMTQESPPSRSRNSTARTSAARSPQNERTVARFSGPGLSVATRKIAARVSGAATACASAGDLPAATGSSVESGFIEFGPCVGNNIRSRAVEDKSPILL